MAWSKVPFCCAPVLAVFLAGALAGQTSAKPSSPPAPQAAAAEKSLAEIARDAKKSRQAATKTVTQEDLDAEFPLPALNMEGVDNSAEVITAINEYMAKHSKEETEDAIHNWYDRYDSTLATAIHENDETRKRRESTNFTGYQLCLQSPSYQNCEARRQAEMRDARADQFAMTDNSLLTARIQQHS
jgi:hypothetical protein